MPIILSHSFHENTTKLCTVGNPVSMEIIFEFYIYTRILDIHVLPDPFPQEIGENRSVLGRENVFRGLSTKRPLMRL